ncbi:unnamed protein product [Amoebophrya sp. A120]|nr:unnamed protein product [Amoebophrya sp. A120]|eukprot:GSA120T00002191001.1
MIPIEMQCGVLAAESGKEEISAARADPPTLPMAAAAPNDHFSQNSSKEVQLLSAAETDEGTTPPSLGSCSAETEGHVRGLSGNFPGVEHSGPGGTGASNASAGSAAESVPTPAKLAEPHPGPPPAVAQQPTQPQQPLLQLGAPTAGQQQPSLLHLLNPPPGQQPPLGPPTGTTPGLIGQQLPAPVGLPAGTQQQVAAPNSTNLSSINPANLFNQPGQQQQQPPLLGFIAQQQQPQLPPQLAPAPLVNFLNGAPSPLQQPGGPPSAGPPGAAAVTAAGVLPPQLLGQQQNAVVPAPIGSSSGAGPPPQQAVPNGVHLVGQQQLVPGAPTLPAPGSNGVVEQTASTNGVVVAAPVVPPMQNRNTDYGMFAGGANAEQPSRGGQGGAGGGGTGGGGGGGGSGTGGGNSGYYSQPNTPGGSANKGGRSKDGKDGKGKGKDKNRGKNNKGKNWEDRGQQQSQGSWSGEHNWSPSDAEPQHQQQQQHHQQQQQNQYYHAQNQYSSYQNWNHDPQQNMRGSNVSHSSNTSWEGGGGSWDTGMMAQQQWGGYDANNRYASPVDSNAGPGSYTPDGMWVPPGSSLQMPSPVSSFNPAAAGDLRCRYYRRVNVGPSHTLTAGCYRGHECRFVHDNPGSDESSVYDQFINNPLEFVASCNLPANSINVFENDNQHPIGVKKLFESKLGPDGKQIVTVDETAKKPQPNRVNSSESGTDGTKTTADGEPKPEEQRELRVDERGVMMFMQKPTNAPNMIPGPGRAISIFDFFLRILLLDVDKCIKLVLHRDLACQASNVFAGPSPMNQMPGGGMMGPPGGMQPHQMQQQPMNTSPFAAPQQQPGHNMMNPLLGMNMMAKGGPNQHPQMQLPPQMQPGGPQMQNNPAMLGLNPLGNNPNLLPGGMPGGVLPQQGGLPPGAAGNNPLLQMLNNSGGGNQQPLPMMGNPMMAGGPQPPSPGMPQQQLQPQGLLPLGAGPQGAQPMMNNMQGLMPMKGNAAAAQPPGSPNRGQQQHPAQLMPLPPQQPGGGGPLQQQPGSNTLQPLPMNNNNPIANLLQQGQQQGLQPPPVPPTGGTPGPQPGQTPGGGGGPPSGDNRKGT